MVERVFVGERLSSASQRKRVERFRTPKVIVFVFPNTHTHGVDHWSEQKIKWKKKSFFRERKTSRSVPIFYIFISRLSKGCWSGSNITIIIEIPPLLFLVSIVLHESIASDNGPQNYDETIRHFPFFSIPLSNSRVGIIRVNSSSFKRVWWQRLVANRVAAGGWFIFRFSDTSPKDGGGTSLLMHPTRSSTVHFSKTVF